MSIQEPNNKSPLTITLDKGIFIAKRDGIDQVITLQLQKGDGSPLPDQKEIQLKVVNDLAELFFNNLKLNQKTLSDFSILVTDSGIFEKEDRKIDFITKANYLALKEGLTSLFKTLKKAIPLSYLYLRNPFLYQSVSLLSSEKNSAERDHDFSAGFSANEQVKQLAGTGLETEGDHDNEMSTVLCGLQWQSASQCSKQLFANLHGDSFINKTSLEGANVLETLTYFHTFLIQRFTYEKGYQKKIEELSALFTECIEIETLRSLLDSNPNVNPEEQAATMQQLITLVTQKLTSLQVGARLMMAGGYNSSSCGHTVYYEIVRREKNFIFKIYNTGDGLAYHPATIVKGTERCFPLYEIENVRAEELLHPLFLKTLFEVASYSRTKNNSPNDCGNWANFSATTLYQNLFSALGGHVVDHTSKIKQFIAPQISGTCPVRALLAFLRFELPEREFCRFEFQLLQQSLIDFYLKNASSLALADDEESQILLEKSSQILSRQLKTNFLAGILDETDLLLNKKVIGFIYEKVRSSSLLSDYQAYGNVDRHHFTLPTLTFSNPLYSKSNQIASSLESKTPEADEIQSPQFLGMSRSWQPNTATISSELKSWLKRCTDEYQKNRKYQVALFITDLFIALPLPIPATNRGVNFWVLPSDDLLPTMHALAQLGELLLLACEDGNQSTNSTQVQEKMIGLFKAVAIQHSLASQLTLQSFPLCYPVFGLFHSPGMGNATIRNARCRNDFNHLFSAEGYFNRSTTTPSFAPFDADLSYFKEINSEIENVPNRTLHDEESFIVHYCRENQSQAFIAFPSLKNCQDKTLFQKTVILAYTDLTGTFLPLEFCLLKKLYLMMDLFINNYYLLQPLEISYENDPHSSDTTAILPLKDCLKLQDVWVGIVRDNGNWTYWGGSHYEQGYLCLSSVFYDDSCSLNSNSSQVEISEEELMNLKSILIARSTEDLDGEIKHELDCMQIDKALSYFQSNFHKLQLDDYQEFLTETVFMGFYLRELLIKNPHYSSNLIQFVKAGFDYHYYSTIKGQNFIGAVFFVNLAILLKAEFQALQSERPDYSRHCTEALEMGFQFKATLNKLRGIALSEREKTSLCMQELHHFSELSPHEMTLDDIRQMVISLAYYKNRAVYIKTDANIYLSHVIERLEVNFVRPQLKEMSNDREFIKTLFQSLLEEVLKNDTIKIDQLIWDSTGTVCRYQKYSFSIEQCLLSIEGHTLCRLPAAITSFNSFKKIFPHNDFLCTLENSNLYTFTDQDGLPVRIESIGNALNIYKQFNPNHSNALWSIYVTDQIRLNGYLYETKTHWKNEQEILLCELKSNTITHRMYYADENNHLVVKSIKKASEDGYFLATMYESGPFINFEKRHQHLLWVNVSGEPIELELPRYSLSFSINMQTQKAACKQFPGYFLAAHQGVRGMKNFKQFLVIENEETGKRKALIPIRDISRSHSTLQSPSLFYTYYHESWKLLKYLAYDLNSEGQLIGNTVEKNLYLSYLFTGIGFYDQAQRLLRAQKNHLQGYTVAEKAILEKLITGTFDPDPKALALNLTALALHLRDKKKYTSSIHRTNDWDDDTLEEFLSNYYQYQNAKEYMGNLSLTLEEEMLILSLLRKSFQDDNRVHLRLKELTTGVYSNDLVVTLANSVLLSPFFENENALLKALHSSEFNPLQNKAGTEPYYDISTFSALSEKNPAKMIRFDLLKIYDEAKRGMIASFLPYRLIQSFEPKKQGMTTSEETSQQMLTFLNLVFSYPDQFPTLAELQEMLRTSVIEKNGSQENALVRLYTVCKTLITLNQSYIHPTSTFTNAMRLFSSQAKANEATQGISIQLSLPSLMPLSLSDELVNDLFDKPECIRLPQISLADEAQNGTNQLISFFNERQSHSQLEEMEKGLLFEGIKKYASRKSQPFYQLKLSKDNFEDRLLTAKRKLEIQKAEIGKTKNAFMAQLLHLANKEGSTQTSDVALYSLDVQGERKQPLTLENICLVLTMKNWGERLSQFNPKLTVKDNAEIKRVAINFLLFAIEQQAIEEQLKVLEALILEASHCKKDELQLQAIGKQLFQTLTQKRNYSPNKQIEMLVFEYFTGMRLRPEQVNNLFKLHSPNKVLQMIMGSGKTKVILPLLARQFALQGCFTTVILPESVFKIVVNDLQTTYRKAFQSDIVTLSFTRYSYENLAHLYELVQEIFNGYATGKCLVTTPRSLQTLYLSFIEHVLDLPTKQNAIQIEKITLLQKLLRLWKSNNGKAIIDEIDLTLHAKQEVNFSIGMSKSLDARYCSYTTLLYEIILQKQNFVDRFGLTPDQINAPDFDEKFYEQDAKPYLIAQLVERILGSKQDPLKTLLEQAESKQQILDYFNDDPKSYLFIRTLSENERDLLSLIKEQLNHLLPITLSKRCDVNYGRSIHLSNFLAIPFHGNNNRIETAQFANPFELMNYMIQVYSKQGVSYQQINFIITQLKDRMAIEIQKEPSLGTITNTKSYQDFLWLCHTNSYDLTRLNQAQIQEITGALNKNGPERYMEFLRRFILPLIKVQKEKISSTPHDLLTIFGNTCGFSGTTYNHHSFPEKARINTEVDHEIDGTSCVLLWNKCQKAIPVLPKVDDVKKLLVSMLQDHTDANAIIDTGASFAGQSNRYIAEELLQIFASPHFNDSQIKGIRYFHNNDVYLVEKGKNGYKSYPEAETILTPKQIFTYYDQSNTTGADFKLPETASAIQTVSRNLTLRSLVQGAWRLRRLEEQQQIYFKVMAEAADSLYTLNNLKPDSPISIGHLLNFALINQVNEQTDLLIASTKQKTHHCLKKMTYEYLLCCDFQQKNAVPISSAIRPLLVTKVEDSPFALFGRPEELLATADIIAEMKEQVFAKIKALPNGLFGGKGKELLEQNLNQEMSIDTLISLLPKEMASSLASDKEMIESLVEIEVENENFHQVEVHNHEFNINKRDLTQPLFQWKEDVIYTKAFITPTPFKDSGSGKLFEIGEAFSTTKLRYLTPLFDRLLTSQNLLGGCDFSRFLQNPQLPVQYLLIAKEIGSEMAKVVMLNHETDLLFFFNAISAFRGKRKETELILCSIDGGFVNHDYAIVMKEWSTETLAFVANQRVRAKLFAGHLKFSKEEEQILDGILAEVGAKMILNLLFDYVLSGSLEKQKQFKNSEFHKKLLKML